MQPTLVKQLSERYPEIYGELQNVDCGDGWFVILDALGEALAICAEADGRRPPQVLSCKEKFGRLVFAKLHLAPQDQRTFEIATSMSLRLCEHCGGLLGMAQVPACCVCSA